MHLTTIYVSWVYRRAVKVYLWIEDLRDGVLTHAEVLLTYSTMERVIGRIASARCHQDTQARCHLSGADSYSPFVQRPFAVSVVWGTVSCSATFRFVSFATLGSLSVGEIELSTQVVREFPDTLLKEEQKINLPALNLEREQGDHQKNAFTPSNCQSSKIHSQKKFRSQNLRLGSEHLRSWGFSEMPTSKPQILNLGAGKTNF